MLKIGDLAKRTQVTVKTLHHYDDIGLLKPVQIDSQTGYRYYATEQEERLNRILALKDLGLSLEQIGHMLDRDLSEDIMRNILQIKHTDLRYQLRDIQAQLTRVETHLKRIEHNEDSTQSEASKKQIKRQKLIKDNTMSHIQEITTDTFDQFTEHLKTGRKRYLPMIFGTTLESTRQTEWLDTFNDQYAYLIDHQSNGECAYALRRTDHRSALWFSFILPSNWDNRFDILDASLPNLIAWFNTQDAYRYLYAQLGRENIPPTFQETFLPIFIKRGFNTEYRMNMHRPADLSAPEPLPLPEGILEAYYTEDMCDELAVFAHKVYTDEGINYSLENARRNISLDGGPNPEYTTLLRNKTGNLVGCIWWGLDIEPCLGEFLVTKTLQGKGYGHFLLNKAIRHIKRRFPKQSIHLGTCREWHRARSLYEAYGFIPNRMYTNLNMHKLSD